MLNTGTVGNMFTVVMSVRIAAPRRPTEGEITDLIEAVVDNLDAVGMEPDVSTSRAGDDVEGFIEYARSRSRGSAAPAI